MAAKLPKKPKAPKQSASLASWQNYDARLKEWKNKCAQIIRDKAAKKSLIERTRKAAASRATGTVSGVRKRRKSAPKKTAKRKARR
jgi:hypothetical protein